MNKRWRELAELAWDQIDSIYSSELADGEIELAKHFILETIWTAVNEERERMVVKWPMDADILVKINEFHRDFGTQAQFHLRDWLRQHAKVGVRE